MSEPTGYIYYQSLYQLTGSFPDLAWSSNRNNFNFYEIYYNVFYVRTCLNLLAIGDRSKYLESVWSIMFDP